MARPLIDCEKEISGKNKKKISIEKKSFVAEATIVCRRRRRVIYRRCSFVSPRSRRMSIESLKVLFDTFRHLIFSGLIVLNWNLERLSNSMRKLKITQSLTISKEFCRSKLDGILQDNSNVFNCFHAHCRSVVFVSRRCQSAILFWLSPSIGKLNIPNGFINSARQNSNKSLPIDNKFKQDSMTMWLPSDKSTKCWLFSKNWVKWKIRLDKIWLRFDSIVVFFCRSLPCRLFTDWNDVKSSWSIVSHSHSSWSIRRMFSITSELGRIDAQCWSSASTITSGMSTNKWNRSLSK